MDFASNPVSPRSRRQMIEAAAACVAITLPGCAGGDETTTETSTSGVTTPTSDPQTMSKGSLIVEVSVNSQFDGSTVLKADCREEDLTIGSGENARIERRTAGETCAIQLDINSETTFDAEVFAYESYHLTVTREGEVEKETVEL